MIKELEELESILTNQLGANVDLKQELKRKELEMQDLKKEFFISVINVIDSFETKDENLKERYAEETVAQRTIKSYSSIKRQLLYLLERHGVTQLEFPENRLIVGFSTVLETEPDNTKENDEIISVIKQGYIRGSELIREAELIVVRN